MEIFTSSPEFLAFEKGLVDEAQFRNFIRNAYHINASDEAIDECWNAMLLGLPQSKIDLVTTLRQRYRVFLLSNTNSIHLRYINEIIVRDLTGDDEIDVFFDRAYYSHRMGMRKPDAEIYLRVLEENQLKPATTLFLDDNRANVDAANALGINSVYVTSTETIFDVFR